MRDRRRLVTHMAPSAGLHVTPSSDASVFWTRAERRTSDAMIASRWVARAPRRGVVPRDGGSRVCVCV
jgi:hypothetical protein